MSFCCKRLRNDDRQTWHLVEVVETLDDVDYGGAQVAGLHRLTQKLLIEIQEFSDQV